MDPAADKIRPGKAVRVRKEILIPKFERGGVSHSSSGVVESVTHDGIAVVDFPCCFQWHGLLSELEVDNHLAKPLVRRRVAIIIGNHKYTDAEAYPDLPGALKDAEEMQKKLKDIAFDFVLPVMNMCLRDVEVWFRQLGQRVMDGDIVVIYFAGHGEEDHQSVLLAGHDSNSKVRDSKISTDLIFDSVASWSSKDLFVCFILDCCRLKSDDCGSSSRLTTRAPIPEKDLARNQFYWVHSCQKFKSAYEQENGHFSRGLLDLLGEDLAVQQLFEQVTLKLGWRQRQRPQILLEGHEASHIKLASANNIYRSFSSAVQGDLATSSSGVSADSELFVSGVERLKSCIQDGDQRVVIDSLCDVRQLLSTNLFAAVEDAVLQGQDPLVYAEGLGKRDLHWLKFIFDVSAVQPADGSSSHQRRGVSQQFGEMACDIPDAILRLSEMMRNCGSGGLDGGCKGIQEILKHMEEVLSPRLLLAIKQALCHCWTAKHKQAQQQQHQALPAVAVPASAPLSMQERAIGMECCVGQQLLDHLFDEGYCANLAFILKLVEEQIPSATHQVANAQSVWSDPALGLSTLFLSSLIGIFAGKCPGTEGNMCWSGLSSKEADIVRSILELSRRSKQVLLSSVPVPPCVDRMAALVSEPLLDLCQSRLEGVLLAPCFPEIVGV